MAKPSYRDTFKDIKYNSTQGFGDWSHEAMRNADSINRSKTNHEDSNTCNGKLHLGSTILHLRYLICREESEYNIGRMMECS
jgi:hypothetical protein